jgi:hypothetical protein
VSAPDLWVIPVTAGGAPLGFGLVGNGKLAQYSSGAQIWTAVDRPKRKPLLEFTADQLWQLDLSLILDGSDTDTSVEAACTQVGRWIKPDPATGEPPILSVQGPIDQQGVSRWVAFTVGFSDAEDSVIRRRDGARVRQDLTLTLIEYPVSGASTPAQLSTQLTSVLAVLAQSGTSVPDQLQTLIQQLPALLSGAAPSLTASITGQLAAFLAAVPSNPAGASEVVADALPQLAQILPLLGGGRGYVWRDGDTLERVAARELGDYRKARALAQLNGLRDGRSLVTGARILLP